MTYKLLPAPFGAGKLHMYRIITVVLLQQCMTWASFDDVGQKHDKDQCNN